MSRARILADYVSSGDELALKAPLASPAFTGSPSITLGSDATGDVYYRAAGGALTRLATGADGTVLTSTGAAAVPAFEAVPAGGKVLQVKVVNLAGTAISHSLMGFVGVSATDITVNRTLGTNLLYSLSGGTGQTLAGTACIRTLAKRTSGSSFSGSEVALGDTTYGNSRLRTGGDTEGYMNSPHSSVAIDDSTSISGDYTYRWFYTGESNTANFSATNAGNTTITIMEYSI